MIQLALVATPATPPATRPYTLTATYIVTGNDGTPAVPPVPAGPDEVHTLEGDGFWDGIPAHVLQTVTLPGTPAVPGIPAVPPKAVTFVAPSFPGKPSIVFQATADPQVFTAVIV